MKPKNLLFLTILAAIILIAGLSKLYAQKAPEGLSISPSNFEITIEPGKEAAKTINLDNLSGSPVDIEVKTRNFTASGEEGNVSLTGEDIPYSLASWITVNPSKTTIPSKKRGTFTFTVKVPKTAEPGGHFGSVIFATSSKKNLNETGAFVSQEIGALILVKIPGNVDEKATLESFTASKFFYKESPVEFSARIKNESTVHIKPAGTITITGMFGQRKVIPVEERNILPGAIRKLPASFTERILIGKYTASISLFYGAKNQNLTAVTEFYAFPVKLGLIVFGVLIILFVLRKRLLKAFRVIIIGK